MANLPRSSAALSGERAEGAGQSRRAALRAAITTSAAPWLHGAALTGTERSMRRGFGLALAALTLVGAVGFLSVSQLREEARWETHTERVIAALRLVRATIAEGETAIGGFVVTGDERQLLRYPAGRQELSVELRDLRGWTEDNATQRVQLDRLAPLIVAQAAVAERIVARRRDDGFAAAQAEVASGEGKLLHDQIRVVIATMETTEQRLLQRREERASYFGVLSRTAVASGVGLAFVFGAAGLLLMKKQFARRRRTEAALRDAEVEVTTGEAAQAALGVSHDELERRVAERTGELSEANRTLRAEVGERRKTEESLRIAKERMESLLTGMADAYHVIDRDWRYVDANAAALQAIGELMERPGRQILGQRLWELFPAVVGTELERQYRRAMEERVAVNFEFYNAPRDTWRHYRIYPVADGVAVFTNDVTESKRAVEALRESETRFRELAENIQEVFWIADPVAEGKIYLSPAYEKIWGRTCASAYAQPGSWSAAIRPEDRGRVVQALTAQQAQGAYDEEYRILRPDGAERWIRDRAFPVRDAAGTVKRWVGVAEDVTEYRNMEEQFRQTQKMEAIGTLAGGIAHDFNNILAAINGYTELARMILTDNPKVRDHLGSVLQASTRATDLIRQILAFSRQQRVSRRVIQLRGVIEESLKLLRATLPTTIEFDLALATDAPTVLADATQVHQILMNLGTNAWHAMKERPGRLTVRLERCLLDTADGTGQPWQQAGEYARITVTDTGCGMDEATRRRIFEPFFTTKPPGEGTGLGLSVVHGIMSSHDGVMTVRSRPGEGTSFLLDFPAHAGEPVAEAVVRSEVPRGRGERILLVDDEALLAQLGQQTLTALGYEVAVTTRSLEALDWVRADPERFALVITDQTMPGMTGLALAGQIQKIRCGLPIIMMSGYSATLSDAHLKAAGIRQLLLKPTTLNALGLAVHATLADAGPS